MPTSNLSISYHFEIPPPSSSMDWFSWLSRTTLEPSLIYDYSLTFARNELHLEDATYFNHEFLQSMGISIAKHRLEILKLVKKEEEGTTTIRPKKLSGVIKKCLRKCMSKFVSHDVKEITLPTPLSQPPHEPNWYPGKWKGAVMRKQGSGENLILKEEIKPPAPVPMYRSRTIALSGPLDGRMHEKMVTNKALKLSGPLDGRMNDRMMYANSRSPIISSRSTVDGRFNATSTKSPRLSGSTNLEARMMLESRSPRLPRPSDAMRLETESPIGHSPLTKPKGDFDYDGDDDHALWPSLFQDLKPT